MIKLLYIEDDFVDQRVFKIALTGLPYKLATSFEHAKEILAEEEVDLTVTDFHLGPDTLTEHPDIFTLSPTIILSNSNFHQALPPLLLFNKPIDDDFISFIHFFSQSQKLNFSMDFLKEICAHNTTEIENLLSLIHTELLKTKNTVINQYNANQQNLLQSIIHKAISKFPMIGLSEAAKFFKELETELIEGGKTNKKDLLKSIAILEASIVFVTKQIKVL